ncbi:hypothetical protein Tel_08970 [Candidatus Tenderia electrophaga]|jgi:uncharacterized protein (DUF1499 family)|uniref:DUF1499 domain-containing protein n=1 Tax=Candidatus Tenderia electrophaga TaxID=1748243 RepID=A0A0S2TDP1_9GAMM|nr:hypothetical protein Tel_08970 [Candidatus Tenderia electrophaga]
MHSPQRPLSKLAVSGVVLAVAGMLMAALSGLGTRMDMWHFSVGFTLLKWAAIIAAVALAVALIALYVTQLRQTRRGTLPAFLGIIIAATTLTPPLLWMQRAAAVPRIHDITTDTVNPPRFDAVLPLRRDAPNASAYGGAEIARQQRQAYPEVQPLVFAAPPRDVFPAALATAQEMGWHIVAADADSTRIEATDTTFWFGFKDDVVVRIRAHEGGSRVDVRSLSRVGLSDVGTNARRIVTYLDSLSAKLGQQETLSDG